MLNSSPVRRLARSSAPKRLSAHCRSGALASLALLLLAGCASSGGGARSGEQLAALNEQARTLSLAGDHDAARQVYLSMARRSSGETRVRYRILAAAATGRAGRHRRALNELLAIEPPPRLLGLWSLAAAASERALDGEQAAYNRLAAVDVRAFPDVAGDLVRARLELLFTLGRPTDALGELTRLGADFSEAQRSAAELTWSLLREYQDQISSDGLTGAARGWIDLALLAQRLANDPTEAQASLAAWHEAFPEHPAVPLLKDTVAPEICAASPKPARLAMLLPGAPSREAELRSLRDGFLAARYALMPSCAAPEIVFYEVANTRDAASKWIIAAAEGADFIVGPLLPESVESAASVAGGKPTLALNRLRERAAPANFEQFALAPEHEARQVARQALSRGLRRALVLHPGTDWGRRIYRSFVQEYEAGGGELAGREQYSLMGVDYSEQIGRLLKTGASNRRAQALQARLGRNLSFQPRRRQDADFVFVVAQAPQGQLLVPQLRYNYSGELPLYAIQAIFNEENTGNQDVEGVELAALPVLARQHVQLTHGGISEDLLSATGLNVPLFAMGYDSFKLALALYGETGALADGIRGLTGTIYRTPGGSLERKLAWTQIVDGKLTAAAQY